jgi:hypothetical protein
VPVCQQANLDEEIAQVHFELVDGFILIDLGDLLIPFDYITKRSRFSDDGAEHRVVASVRPTLFPLQIIQSHLFADHQSSSVALSACRLQEPPAILRAVAFAPAIVTWLSRHRFTLLTLPRGKFCPVLKLALTPAGQIMLNSSQDAPFG